MPKIENARIASTFLGVEDHGIFTASLGMEGDGWGCGFGNYALDSWSDKAKRRVPAVGCGLFVARVLEVLGVDRWEKLKGQHCRVEMEGLGGGILRVGHLVKNQWFDPKAEFEALRSLPDDPRRARGCAAGSLRGDHARV